MLSVVIDNCVYNYILCIELQCNALSVSFDFYLTKALLCFAVLIFKIKI